MILRVVKLILDTEIVGVTHTRGQHVYRCIIFPTFHFWYYVTEIVILAFEELGIGGYILDLTRHSGCNRSKEELPTKTVIILVVTGIWVPERY